MPFTLPQPPETSNIRALAAFVNTNSGGGGGSTDWSAITSKPTTLSGFGITDAYTKAASDARYAVAASTLAGYGITDAYTKAAADSRFLQLSGGTLTGSLFVDGVLYAGAAATTRTAGDINARRNANTGVYYFGDGTQTFLLFNGTTYVLGNNSSTASLALSGQVRATGWFQAGDDAFGGIAAELGVTSGSAFLISIQRSDSTFQPLGFEASDITLFTNSGANPTCNGQPMSRSSAGTATPTGTPEDGDLYFQHS